MTTRRQFLWITGLSLLPAGVGAQQPVDGSAEQADTCQAQADRLYQPEWTGRNRDTLTALDNDPILIATERRLRCTCGCTLDVYTCRTTDFSCTFSPALHKEIAKMFTEGKTPAEVVAHFVEREGEAILMAPPAEGFNIAGYVVPGLAMASAMLALIAWVSRRKNQVSEVAVSSPQAPTRTVTNEADRERLQRALDDVDA